MRKCFFGLIGFVLLAGGFLLRPIPATGGEAVPSAKAVASAASGCCAHCGECLVPVCRVCCTTKKVTEYKYRYVCDEMCLPGVTPICQRRAADESGDSCPSCCGGRCNVHQIKKLVKVPVTKEVPVRTCTVEWVCPSCSQGESTSAPAAAPAVPIPVPPAPMPKMLPPRPKTNG